MRLFINIVAGLFSVGALLVTINYVLGIAKDAFDGSGGMAILVFQLWGMVASAGAMLFGFIGRIMDRRAPRPASRLSNGAIAIGLTCGLMIFASAYF